MLQICCKNNNISKNFPIGSSLLDIYNGFNLDIPYGPVSAKVNNKVEGLNYRAYNNKDVEFLNILNPSGMRTMSVLSASSCAKRWRTYTLMEKSCLNIPYPKDIIATCR